MLTTAPHNEPDNAKTPVVCLAVELRANPWKLGCTLGHGQPPREHPMAARVPQRRRNEGAPAKARCGLGATVPVVRCDEAGREGFWLPRVLQTPGLTQQGVESSLQ
jgi:hypothetical protein